MGDNRVRLHGVVVNHWKGKVIFDHNVRLSQSFFYVAALDPLVATDVVTVIFVNQRRAIGTGRVDPDHGREFFVLHVDKGRRLLGRRQICRRHRRHGFAHVTNSVRGNHRTTIVSWHAVTKIRGRQHGCDPRQSLCL